LGQASAAEIITEREWQLSSCCENVTFQTLQLGRCTTSRSMEKFEFCLAWDINDFQRWIYMEVSWKIQWRFL